MSSHDLRRLTAREDECLDLVEAGCSDRQIALRLGVSPKTVGKHLQNIYAKLGVRDRRRAVSTRWRNDPGIIA